MLLADFDVHYFCLLPNCTHTERCFVLQSVDHFKSEHILDIRDE